MTGPYLGQGFGIKVLSAADAAVSAGVVVTVTTVEEEGEADEVDVSALSSSGACVVDAEGDEAIINQLSRDPRRHKLLC